MIVFHRISVIFYLVCIMFGAMVAHFTATMIFDEHPKAVCVNLPYSTPADRVETIEQGTAMDREKEQGLPLEKSGKALSNNPE